MDDIVALSRYPLECPGSGAYRRLTGGCARVLADTGLLNLEGFLTPGGAARLVSEVEALMPVAHYAERDDNAYGSPAAEGMPADHPSRILHPTARWGIAYHQMRGTVLEALYRWPPPARLRGRHHRSREALPARRPLECAGAADLQGRWQARMALRPGAVLHHSEPPGIGGGWHLRVCPESAWPRLPLLRRGAPRASRRVRPSAAPSSPGGLVHGHPRPLRLHRVTTVRGPAPRISLILSYEDRPGVRMDVATRRKLFGLDAPED